MLRAADRPLDPDRADRIVGVIGLAVLLGLPDGIWGTITHLVFLTAVAAAALKASTLTAASRTHTAYGPAMRHPTAAGQGTVLAPARRSPGELRRGHCLGQGNHRWVPHVVQQLSVTRSRLAWRRAPGPSRRAGGKTPGRWATLIGRHGPSCPNWVTRRNAARFLLIPGYRDSARANRLARLRAPRQEVTGD